jgi:hypothetical protein
MRVLRSSLLVVLGVAIGLPTGLVIGSRPKRDPVPCIPGLRNLDAAVAQWDQESGRGTNAARLTNNSLPVEK